MKNATTYRAWSLILLIGFGFWGWSIYRSDTSPDGRHFKFGLDLVGGSHLVYEADTSAVDSTNVVDAMSALRDVIERRVNLFGVAEPLVQVEKASSLSNATSSDRLIVELPGITNLEEAVKMIGATPVLEFKLVGDPVGSSTESTYIDTGLTGRYLVRARLEFSGARGQSVVANEPLVLVDFNDEGKKLFSDITKANVGKQLAIFLDGALISDPVIREEIRGGTAVISGNFTTDKAKELVRNLNIGALPVPIHLASTESVGASLGMETLDKGVKAGMWGIGIVMLFLMAWYRVPGFLASLALIMYIIINLGIYMFIPITITAAGLAGFILSSGMAVDANVLIFERIKDEMRRGKSVQDAVREGVSRAWLPIRDGNFHGVLTAIVLFWFGTASVEGFALTLMIGILVSMFSAIIVTRTFLLAIAGVSDKPWFRNLFLSGTSTNSN